jgi:hypothetical protein
MPRRRDYRRMLYQLAIARGQPAPRPKTLRCMWCNGIIHVGAKGKLPDYCKPSCRQRAYEMRKWRQPHLAALRQDYTTILRRDAIRAEILAILRDAGVPFPDPPQPRKRATLRVVENDEGEKRD